MPYRILMAGLAWVAVCTWAEARRETHQSDNPALAAGIEADLASRYCTGFKIDASRFQNFAHAHALNHADYGDAAREVRLLRRV